MDAIHHFAAFRKLILLCNCYANATVQVRINESENLPMSHLTKDIRKKHSCLLLSNQEQMLPDPFWKRTLLWVCGLFFLYVVFFVLVVSSVLISYPDPNSIAMS